VQAVGFVVGQNIETGFDLLGQWLNAGHSLGNMTYSNQDINGLAIEQFVGDIGLGAETLEPILSGFGQKERYFRYPFLHYGTTVEKRQEVGLFIEQQNYILCHATVVVEDYLYNLTLSKMGKTPDSARFDALLNEYINHVLDEIERNEALAKRIMGRSVRHILRLRANRLNAVLLDEMLTAMKDIGCEFITLRNALQDQLYLETEAYYGAKGLGYLDMIDQSNPDLMPAE
jgi:peptidoglycan/xylan/chitin deacetylase (PgdA/CDA1 family)